jgi:hypothetical protein
LVSCSIASMRATSKVALPPLSQMALAAASGMVPIFAMAAAA